MRLPIALAGLTRSRARRLALLAPLALLLATLGGDRSAIAIVDRGIDPLEVLNLYVRPNVIIVLDASGSMTGTVGTDDTFSGDHPRSRIGQAKQVIRDLVQQNQSKVNFQMGAYTQSGSALQNSNPVLASGHGSYRFQYVARTDDYPSATDEQMETGELTIMGDLGRTVPPSPACNAGGTACDAQQRGLQSWQIVPVGGNVLVYNEGAVTCTVTITPTKKFYRAGGPATASATPAPAGTLAADVETAMNGCAGRGATPNVYRVSYVANTGIFTLTRWSGTASWRPRWTLSSARARFGYPTSNPADPAAGGGPFSTWTPFMLLIRRPGAIDSASWGQHWRIRETGVGTPAHTIDSHQVYAGAYFNGEVVRVDPNGTVCDVTFPSAPLPVPAKVTLQGVATGCGGDTGTPVDFVLGGGEMSGNQSPANCAGYTEGAGLRPCDQNGGDVQLQSILPVIDREVPMNSDGTLTDYSENPATLRATLPGSTVGGARAAGNTPIANSLQDIKTNFNLLWSTGQVACPAGTPSGTTYKWDVQHCPDRDGNGVSDPGYTRLALDAISTHTDPKERTIVLFVTDGDDTCTGSGGDNNALWSAARAQALYTRIVATEPASSVQTYVLGFGNGATPDRLNWIAWGGSGLVKTGTPWSSTPSAVEVAACKAQGLCQDAFLAPDAETLAGYLQGIINQGVTSGEFVAQTPVFPNVYEMVGTISGTPAGILEAYNPSNPETRYKGFVPLRFQTSFVLPGFQGKAAAYGNVAGVTTQVWEASSKMVLGSPTYGFDFTTAKCRTANACTFGELKGGSTSDQTIATSNAAIKRRIYTTSGNGVFPVTTANLVDLPWMRTQGTGGKRVTLWPPQSSVAPQDYTSQGELDWALGLPIGTLDAAALGDLQSKYRACQGLNLHPNCTVGNPSPTAAQIATQVRAARREAREMILAYMAGGEWEVAADANPKRYPSTDPVSPYQIQYKPRNAPLADATYGTPAVVGVPADGDPTIHSTEYTYFRDGGTDSSGAKTDGTLQGFGLRHPDKDDTVCPPGPTCQNDSRTNLKPQMTVAYVGSNDMLHAFRAGCSDPANMGYCYAATGDAGQELWGLVPYDQLGKLGSRLRNKPARRSPHDYMISTGLRFGTVFIPGPLTGSDGSPTLSSLGIENVAGLWRRVLMFGRGQEGKSITAIDITAPGPYTKATLASMPPIVLWNRGNPDTFDGTVGGTKNNTLTTGDFTAYELMGETWSVPTISRVKRLGTYRKPCPGGGHGNPTTGVSELCSDQSSGGVEYVSFVGSGYGEDGTREGYALFTLDTLTGDVVAYADVEAAAVAKGWNRTGGDYPGYRNAIVADPAAFEKDQLVTADRLKDHSASAITTRVYVGDLHGRAWKFVSAQPEIAIPFADLGADQPVAVAAALIQPYRGTYSDLPHVYMIAGNETRAAGPFKLFGLYDEKTSDTDTSEPAPSPGPLMFSRTLQPVGGGTGSYRGTVPPLTFFNRYKEARVVFGATRFNPPNSPDAPPVPPYPCRSSFDSVVYGLRAESGTGAYNLPQDGGAAQFIPDVRIMSVAPMPDPVSGGQGVTPVAGQVSTIPPPPAPGPKPEPFQVVTVSPDTSAPGGLFFRNAASICNQ